MRGKDFIYHAFVDCINLKPGMKIMEQDDPNDENSRCRIYIIASVTITREKVSFQAEVADYEKRVPGWIEDYKLEFNRTPEEPYFLIFLSSVEEGLKFGIKREDIEMS